MSLYPKITVHISTFHSTNRIHLLHPCTYIECIDCYKTILLLLFCSNSSLTLTAKASCTHDAHKSSVPALDNLQHRSFLSYTCTNTLPAYRCIVLPLRHRNWRISPELRNRNIYFRYYTQTLVLERIRLDKGVHVSIVIFSLRIDFVLCFTKCGSLFVAYFSPAKILRKSHRATYAVVVYFACPA